MWKYGGMELWRRAADVQTWRHGALESRYRRPRETSFVSIFQQKELVMLSMPVQVTKRWRKSFPFDKGLGIGEPTGL